MGRGRLQPGVAGLGRTDTPHGEKINLVKILIFGLNILLFFANIDFDTRRTQLNVNMFLK